MAFDDFARAFLACYFGFVAVFYAGELVGRRQRTGLAHDDVGARGTTQFVAHHVFYWFRALILLVCVVRVPWPGLDRYLFALPTPDPPILEAVGMTTMIAALGWVAYVRAYMGEQWRSGVPAEVPGPLLTDGPFGWSRHPVFVGIMAGQLGFALALPSVFSLFCLAVGVTAVLRQCGYEERRLTARFGEDYRRYSERTPRWVPLPRLVPAHAGPVATGRSSRAPHSAQDPS